MLEKYILLVLFWYLFILRLNTRQEFFYGGKQKHVKQKNNKHDFVFYEFNVEFQVLLFMIPYRILLPLIGRKLFEDVMCWYIYFLLSLFDIVGGYEPNLYPWKKIRAIQFINCYATKTSNVVFRNILCTLAVARSARPSVSIN